MNKTIINHWAFRLFTPVVFAFFIYILILLFFDSALQLLDNLISIEYFICLILTFINFEVWRFIINRCQVKCNQSIKKQLLFQILFSLATGIILTGILVWLYFKFLVGLVSFNSELILFCALFGISALLYYMIYLSQFLLNYQHNEILAEQEKQKKEAINRWQRFQNKINPNLLYQSLEKIIGYAYHDIDKADELLIDLTQLYRHILENQDELISIGKELQLVKKLAVLVAKISDHQVLLHIHNANGSDRFIIPGFLLLLIQQVINENIANNLQSLQIDMVANADEIALKYQSNKRLARAEVNPVDMNYENETLQWYTQKEISKQTSDEGVVTLTIPLINLN